MGGKKSERASSKDVARLAGVSQTTVSRVFRDESLVSEKVRAQVLSAAKELHYQPSVIARSLMQRSTRIVCIINGRFGDDFYGQALGHFTSGLQAYGYSTLILNLSGNDMEDTLPIALSYQVDGIIITTSTLSSALVENCKRLRTPAILFNRYTIGSSLSSVCLDNTRAGRDVANYFMERGHRRLAYLAGDPTASTNKDRQEGFLSAIEAAGFEPFAILAGEYSYESGQRAAKKVLSGHEMPDAVFCANDAIAVGFIETARLDFGMKIPRDISVIRFNNSPFSAWRSFDITTVEQPIARMVETTIKLLLESIQSGADESVIKLIPGTIVERGTVVSRRDGRGEGGDGNS
jgi:DNA-binding LacI/PurR family transcriptional regulator